MYQQLSADRSGFRYNMLVQNCSVPPWGGVEPHAADNQRSYWLTTRARRALSLLTNEAVVLLLGVVDNSWRLWQQVLKEFQFTGCAFPLRTNILPVLYLLLLHLALPHSASSSSVLRG